MVYQMDNHAESHLEKYMVFAPTVASSTGRFVRLTIFSAILNANAEIVSEELTHNAVGTIPPSTT